MNARRRDEITHRKFGLHIGCIRSEDEELGVFKGTFYIEKTLQGYLDFYVNKTTKQAIKLLEEIQHVFDGANVSLGRASVSSSPPKEQSLFGYHRFSRIDGLKADRCWYSFTSDAATGQASYFLRRALGANFALSPHPHMFRRLYALVFIYQYENASLQALSAQLGHDDLSATEIYVTDPAMRDEAERIEFKMDVTGSRRTRAFAAHLQALRSEIDIVRDEKLLETVLSILNGEPASGGYPRFIKRFYRRISGRIDFSQLDITAQAQAIKEIVKTRGHSPKTMRHGQCMAGSQLPAHGARCRSETGNLEAKNASPTTCFKCPQHYLSKAYLKNLERDLETLYAASRDDKLTAFERKRAAIDSDNLQKIIEFHRGRLL